MKPHYQGKKSSFSSELRKDVQQYFENRQIGKHGNPQLHITSLLLLIVYIGLAITLFMPSILFNPATYLLICGLLGILTLPLVLNIGHDAVHNTFTSGRKANALAQQIFLILGTSPYFWKLRHIHSHHAFSNVQGWDKDIEQDDVIRLTSEVPRKKQHKLQHIYMPLVFCFYTLNWFFYRDFKDLFTKNFGAKKVDYHPARQWLKLLLAKAIMIFYLILGPVMIGEQSTGLALTGFLLFHLSASIVTTFALVSTHVGTQQEVIIPKDNQLPYSYDEHQLRTTSDFATSNKFLTWYYGGFNNHVAHHLFPNVSHVHYPAITRIIKRYCEAYDMPYHSTPTLWASIKEHLILLKQLSREERIAA